MDARRLSYFLAVAEHRSFTKAGEALHIAQPSLSQSIRALEQELGSPLFRRLSRSIELTPAGEALITPARRALRAMKDAEQAVHGVAQLETGRLELTAPRSLVVYPTVALVAAFSRRFPGVSVEITEAVDSGEAAERIRSGASEVGLLELSGSTTGLRTWPLLDYQLYVAFPPKATRPRSGTLAREELKGLALVALPSGTVTRRIIDEAGAGEGIRVEARSAHALVELVLSGVGAALLIEPHAQNAAKGGAHLVPLEPPLVHRVGVALAETDPAPAAAAFTSLVVQSHTGEPETGTAL
ncbi:MAG: LysR family transcriptional regulator [Nocardioidaceae bacterium]|nr:LysR family transcriptional regulator [Nocardioidaceae bacterium]